MKSIERAAALIAVLGMPVIAYSLARVALSMWDGVDSASLADAGLALEDGLVLLAAAVGAAVATYLALTGYAMLLGAAWRGGRMIPKALASVAPHGWTRVTATALGLSMTAGLAGPALAAEAGAIHSASAGWVAAPVLMSVDAQALTGDGVVAESAPRAIGWVAPDATDTAVTDATASWSALEPSSNVAGNYIVQPGDSLWRITQSVLGSDADDAQVANAWPELYEANRVSIGENASLIQPGLTLTIPVGLGA